jgi:F0F1-type ATP synthase delta subunit
MVDRPHEYVWKEEVFEKAKCRILFETASVEKVIAFRVLNWIEAFGNTSTPSVESFLRKLADVSREDLVRVVDRHFRKLFEETESRTVVLCKTGEEAKVKEGFQE